MKNIKKISTSQKFIMRRLAISKLNAVGIFMLNEKKIVSNKLKDIFQLYNETFQRDLYSDLLLMQKEEVKKDRDLVIKKKLSEVDQSEYVYVIGSLIKNVCKIGYSKNPVSRLKSLQTGCPYKLQFLLIINGNRTTEKQLHRKYRRYKSNGEWFHFREELKRSVEEIALTEKNLVFQF